MNYIVMDLEFNQPFDFPVGDKTFLDSRCPFEIIQIGAIKMDEQFNIVDESDFLIKPSIYSRIHPFVQKITGLDSDLLNSCPIFPEVYSAFLEFIGSDEYVFCVWGSNDIKELFINVAYHNLDESKLSTNFINVQNLASQKLNKPPGMSIGLKNAVESFQLEIDSAFHYALNDAMYTAKIFNLVRSSPLDIQQFKRNTDASAKNYTFNSRSLYKILEKELGRRLTNKEKHLYKKVYYMGRSRQFDS